MTGYHRSIFGPHVLGPDGFRLAPHVGEFFTRMRIDGSQAKADAVKAAADAGAVASKSFGDRWKATFSKENLGKGLMQGLGLGFGLGAVGIAAKGVETLTNAITGSFDAARGWETALTGVSKTLDTAGLSSQEAADALAEIGDGLRDMAKEIPVPVEQLAALAEAGGALGIARTDLLEFTKTAAMLGSTTDVAAQDAATALGKIGAIMPFTREEYSRFAATLVDLGNKGASTESEIVSMAQNMAGAASVVGLSKAELLGWASAMANVGEEAEAGGSSFQRFALGINQAVDTGSTRLRDIADVAGMTGDAFAALWDSDTSEAMRQVVQGLADMDEKSRQAVLASLGFTDIRITRAFLKLTANSDNLNQSLGVGEQAWKDNTAATIEAEKRYGTLDSKLALLQNKLHDAAISFGEVLAGGAVFALDTIDRLGIALQDIADNVDPEAKSLRLRREALQAVAEQAGVSAEALFALADAEKATSDQALFMADWVDRMQKKFGNLSDEVKNGLIGSLEADLRRFVEETGLPFEEVFDTAAANLANFDLQTEGTGRLLAFLAQKFGLVTDATGKVVEGTEYAQGVLARYYMLPENIAPSIGALNDLATAASQVGDTDGPSRLGEAFGELPPIIKGALQAVVDDIDTRKAWFDAGSGFVFDLSAGVRQGVKDSEPELKGAVSELRKKLRFDWDAEAVYAMGKEFIRTVNRGFNSGVPELEQDAEDATFGALVAMDRSGRTGPKAADKIGTFLAGLYARGITRGVIEARLAAEGVNLATLETIAGAKGWREGGFNVANAWVQGFLASMRLSIAPITGLLGVIQDMFDGNSPPPKGPLRHIDRGGYNVGTAWRDAFLAGIGVNPSDITGAMPGLAGLGLSVPVSVSGSLSGDLGQVAGGPMVMEHQHTITAEGAAALRSAGFDEQGVAQMLYRAIRSASDAAGIGYLTPEGI